MFQYKMRQRKRRVLSYAWCNPRLPQELLLMIHDGERYTADSVRKLIHTDCMCFRRRRTIGEPERLAKQLHRMLETRNMFIALREQVKGRDKFLVRRRSFDFGEIKDASEQIDETLGLW
jgi:hypothetical protein